MNKTYRYKCDWCGYEWDALTPGNERIPCPIVIEAGAGNCSDYSKQCPGDGVKMVSSPVVHGMTGKWGVK